MLRWQKTLGLDMLLRQGVRVAERSGVGVHEGKEDEEVKPVMHTTLDTQHSCGMRILVDSFDLT